MTSTEATEAVYCCGKGCTGCLHYKGEHSKECDEAWGRIWDAETAEGQRLLVVEFADTPCDFCERLMEE